MLTDKELEIVMMELETFVYENHFTKALLNLTWFDDMEGIVTRNSKDYKEAGINVWFPEQILQEYHKI